MRIQKSAIKNQKLRKPDLALGDHRKTTKAMKVLLV